MADHVPFGPWQFIQVADFPAKFLDAIFSEDTDTGLVSVSDLPGVNSFCDRHQRDISWITCGTYRCGIYSSPHQCNVLRYGHNGKKSPRTLRRQRERISPRGHSATSWPSEVRVHSDRRRW